MKKSEKSKPKNEPNTPSLMDVLERIAVSLEYLAQSGPQPARVAPQREEDIEAFETEKVVTLKDGTKKKIKFISSGPEKNSKTLAIPDRKQRKDSETKKYGQFTFRDSLPKDFKRG